ncbi:hypothetical protein L596_022928 [Steinernema carpocapsae]|uniref:BTB domain-containing protein n=1 Tax=Steinernema carpocapsae TaxID=34508 RepID=A0A4U5MC23_STECR|nr:hypothetical protein L596_022928 [Steinernema carpocapsae]
MSDNSHMLNSRSVENLTGGFGRLGIHSGATSTSSLRIPEPNPILGEIPHASKLAEDIGNLLMKDNLSDVTFKIDGISFPAHKVIMASRSEYFRALLFGGMRESTEAEIELHDTPVDAFRLLLRYTYTGNISLSQTKESLVLDVLGLAHQYGYAELEKAISDYLQATVDIQNVCTVLAAANLYSLRNLQNCCFDYADMRAEEVLKTEAFRRLPVDPVELLLQRDSFCAPEIKIFEAIKDWINAHSEETESYPRIVACLRMPLIELKDLLHTIRPSRFFSADAILDAIQEQSEKKSCELVYRGFAWPNVNVATTSYASIVEGESRAAIEEDPTNTNQDDKMTRHQINETDPGIVVEFNRPFILNNIRLMLADRDQRIFYSYYVEVGMDRKHWVRVIDHQHYICRSKQNLYFPKRVVKFVRIVGTYCSNSPYFHLSRMEAQYTTEPFTVDTASTLLIPTANVATIPNNALVVEGVSRIRNCLINGDTNSYDWDNGYTCHQVGSGSIAVQLPQPYLIDSLRLLLWDCDDRYYHYYVEVSIDQKNWVRVADKTEEQCRAWQLIRFEQRPVVFVRIVGTHNSANDIFHCVHFECPAQRSTPRTSTAEFRV